MVAPRALPRVRRRRRLLGARGDGQDARSHRRGRICGRVAREAFGRRSPRSSSMPKSGRSSSRGSQHLLGLTDRVAPDREDLFSAWRLFFERMAEENPVIMVFEDIHWADAALLEFVEYLLDWSRAYPIYVIDVGASRGLEKHPGWGAHIRNYTSLTLEPLRGRRRSTICLRGLVPGLPADAVERIRDARRRHAALRRRDRADAPRPRPAQARGGRVRRRRRPRHARRSRDAARADRGAPRRPRAGRATSAPERGGARQDVRPRGLAAVGGTRRG